MSDKIAQTYITRHDGVYFVSTVNRASSAMLAPDMRYSETMAWGPQVADGRGPLVLQLEGRDGSISGHIRACELVFALGNKAGEEANDA